MNAESFATRVRAAIQQVRDDADTLLALPVSVSGGEVIATYDRIWKPLNGVADRVGLYFHVHPDAAMREACEGLEQEIEDLRTELSLHRGLYDRLSAVDAADAPDAGAARVLAHALRDFRRSGVDRSEETRAKIRLRQEELVRLGQTFDKNIVTGGRDFVVQDGHAGLAGLPEDFLRAHPERADGTVLLTTDPQDRVPFLTFAESIDLRREYFLAAMNRAVPENLEVLPQLLAKRHELAGLLGYEHWADYVTEDKMTGSATVARDFIARVVGLVRKKTLEEAEALLEKKRETDPGAERVMEWERFFLADRVKRERHGFDAQSARPYFGYENVLSGVLETSAALYGVEFRPNDDVDVWHDSVRSYDVVDGNEVVARFHLDMHPRDHKFKHTAMFDMAAGLTGETLPEAALVCNFAAPTADDPGLMLHDEVTTLFHEFGHLLHHLFAGDHSFLRFSGIATEHDFVEVPSQIFEEWAWDAGVLSTFARHHETGEPIPADLVARMRAAEEYGKALDVMVQMSYATMSLVYYDRDPAGSDLVDIMIRTRDELLPTKYEEGNNFLASFGHLHGYSAMYYCYMWSLVIAKDLFGRFEGDLMNGAVASEYRAKVLGPGGARDARDLVRDFLGREYGFEAFEKWLER